MSEAKLNVLTIALAANMFPFVCVCFPSCTRHIYLGPTVPRNRNGSCGAGFVSCTARRTAATGETPQLLKSAAQLPLRFCTNCGQKYFKYYLRISVPLVPDPRTYSIPLYLIK
jgi:hypothetical protein